MITSTICPLPLYQNLMIQKQSKYPVNTNAGQDIVSFTRRPLKGQNLKFGVEPLTWISLTTVAHFYRKGIDWTISNIASNPSSEVLENSNNYKNGITYLELAKAVKDEDKLMYIKKAEEKFIEASNDFNTKLFQAECFKYAAVCAQIRKADECTVDHLALKSYNLYVKFNNEYLGRSIPDKLVTPFNTTDVPEVTRKLYVADRAIFKDTFMQRAEPVVRKKQEGCIVQ